MNNLILAWFDTVTPKGCLVRAITLEGALLPPFEVFRTDKANEMALKWWSRYGTVTWLDSNPWIAADFREAVANYERTYGCKLSGYVKSETNAPPF